MTKCGTRRNQFFLSVRRCPIPQAANSEKQAVAGFEPTLADRLF
jgi:hypothetical protein